MAEARAKGGSDSFFFYTQVDDELYDELQSLLGQKVVLATVWEDSLADALEAREGGAHARTLPSAEEGPTCDIDLYLEDGVYFEIYSAAVFPTLDADPLPDRAAVDEALRHLLRGNLSLGDVAVDEEDALVLVLHNGPLPALFLSVGGWLLEEWDELPE